MKKILNIKIAYTIVIVSLIFWAFFAYFTMNQLIITQESYAKIINISGKQRMLSQKTALIVKRVFESNNPQLINLLEKLILTMKDDHKFLLSSITSEKMMDIYLGSKINLNSEVLAYFRLLDSFMKQRTNLNIVENIEKESFNILPKLDYAVNAFEDESESYTTKLLDRELFILVGTLLTILFEAYLVVFPSVRRIAKTEKELKELNNSLEKKLQKQKQMILKEQEKIKKKEKVFYEQSKLISMGEMIGNIAHQWRQPLSVITTIVSTINLKLEYKEKIEDKQLQDYSTKVFEQANYLSKTIDDFRNFIKGEIKHTKINISEVIDKTLNLVSASLTVSSINIIKKTKDDLTIMANLNELQQALINILKNAKDALKSNNSEDNRLIIIETKKINETELILTITDNAGGIELDVINRIFEPYFTTKHSSIGTGIGLSMVDKIIRERHNFLITVENKEFEHEGQKQKGACFIISFKTEE